MCLIPTIQSNVRRTLLHKGFSLFDELGVIAYTRYRWAAAQLNLENLIDSRFQPPVVTINLIP